MVCRRRRWLDGQLGSPLGLSWELPLRSFVSGEWLDLWDELREGADFREKLRMCVVEILTFYLVYHDLNMIWN